jgi:(p)ppGpp synthase/HD superfamily hydrolase
MTRDFEKYHISLRYWMLGKNYHRAVLAMEFASQYHIGTRKDGYTPEFHHQISIAHYLRTLPDLRNQEDVLAAAFLHDTVEDYDVSLTDIESRFGADVARSVKKLSKIVKGYKKSPEEYYQSMIECPIASVVKGGDRVHNHQTMHGASFSTEKQYKYITETKELILPMLKEARRKYPDQELAYENIKHALKGQIELIELVINAQRELRVVERS